MIQTLQALSFLHWLEEIRNPFLTALMSIITYFGHEILPVAVVCIVFWCINKKIGYRIILVYFTSGVSMQTLKMAFRIERPWILDPSLNPVENAIPAATGYSFPSGHTQTATALYSSLAFTVKKRYIKALFVLLFLAVGFSRMYLGVHTLFDVSVGILLSLFFAVLFFYVFDKIPETKKTDFTIALSMLIICIAVLIYAAILYFNGTVVYELIKDAFKTAGAGIGLAIGYYIEKIYIKFDVRSDRIWKQILKIVIGVASALGLKALLKIVLGENIYSDTARYMFLILYIVALYPMTFAKFFAPKEKQNEIKS